MLRRIVSGGQTGADIAGLNVAKKFGFETGGWAPLGFLTENGSEPSLASDFGLVEIDLGGFRGYVVRTQMNVRDSDATIRFASDFGSSGEKCTLQAIKRHDRPYLDVAVNTDGWPAWATDVTPEVAAKWIEDHEIEVLNVAGNRESKCPGIRVVVEDFLTGVFEILCQSSMDKFARRQNHQGNRGCESGGCF